MAEQSEHSQESKVKKDKKKKRFVQCVLSFFKRKETSFAYYVGSH